MRKSLLLLSLFSACILVACNTSNEEIIVDEVDNSSKELVQVANPWEYDLSVELAYEMAGFSVDLPSLDDLSTPKLNAMEWLIEAQYYGEGLPEDQFIAIRKGVESLANEEWDISGDYNEYDVVTDLVIEDINVTAKSYENSGIKLATWTKDGYCYSITFPEASNVDETLLEAIIPSIN